MTSGPEAERKMSMVKAWKATATGGDRAIAPRAMNQLRAAGKRPAQQGSGCVS